MQAKTERFEMRLDQEALNNVDAWRADQSDLPSRAEAVRRLINTGLLATAGTQLKFSDGEKLNALMLCRIYRQLEIQDDIDPEFIESAIYGGHYWGLEWQYPGIFDGHQDRGHVVSEVADVLDMWFFLESGFRRLSKKDKERIEKEAKPFGKNVKFPGFDGNNEAEHLGVARFLIEKLGRFSEFEGRDLNSHFPSLEGYRRMLVIFEPMRPTLIGGEPSASQIIDILKARTYPG